MKAVEVALGCSPHHQGGEGLRRTHLSAHTKPRRVSIQSGSSLDTVLNWSRHLRQTIESHPVLDRISFACMYPHPTYIMFPIHSGSRKPQSQLWVEPHSWCSLPIMFHMNATVNIASCNFGSRHRRRRGLCGQAFRDRRRLVINLLAVACWRLPGS